MTKYLILILTITLSSCFMDGRPKRSAFYAPLSDGSSGYTAPINLDGTITPEQSTPIYDTIISSFESVADNGQYKYGKKTQAKTFTKGSIRVLIDSCINGGQCNVNLFIAKTDQNLRPLFVIPTEVNISSCPVNRRAYITSLTMLASEALTPTFPETMATASLSNLQGLCSQIDADSSRVDYLCRKKANISSIQKQASFSVNYDSSNLFDVSLPAPDYVLNINYNSNLASNMICIDDIFRPSMWGINRSTVSSSDRKNIAVFKVSLKMVQ